MYSQFPIDAHPVAVRSVDTDVQSECDFFQCQPLDE
jgi:hypothetical protein